MGGNYEKGMYSQLMEVMARLDAVEKDLRTEKTEHRAGGQKGHKGTTLTKAEIEEKIKSGRCRHEPRTMGDITSGKEPALSEGSIYGFCRKFSEQVQESIRHLEEGLLNRKVVATDATPVTVYRIISGM